MDELTVTDIATWLRVSEAVHRLKTSHLTVRAWIASGRLRGVRTPYGHLVDPESVERLAREREEQKNRRRSVR